MTSELPSVGVDDIQIKADRAGEIHVFANPEDNVVVHQEDKATGEVGCPDQCQTKNKSLFSNDMCDLQTKI